MSDPVVLTQRQEARVAAESFRGVLATEGDEAFWASVREQVGDHASIEEAKAKHPVMLGALAVEYERVLASASDRQPSIEPGTLANPVSRGNCIAFAGAVSTLMEMYQPDPEFSRALGF